MRSPSLPQAESRRDRPSLRRPAARPRRLAVTLSAVGALTTAVALLFGPLVSAHTTSAQTTSAQTNPAPAPAAAPVHKHVHPRKKSAAAAPAPQPPPPPAPVAPPPPNWPANNLPAAASVVFDSRGLLVVASNSSLTQILKEVSIDTGVKVEGMDADQRVFGTYGPGPARDVLSQLLDGSGYDVLMIGDRGQGTPRRIVLTERSRTAGAQNTANRAAAPPRNEDTDADQPVPEPQAEQEPPQPAPNGAAPSVPMRNPQQIQQEIEERQRQQQQNGQQNPQN